LLSGEGSQRASDKLSLVGRLALRAGRAMGVTSDPSKLREASKAYMPIGKRVVVLGGGLVGCELAEFFVERGRVVTVLGEGATFASEMAHPRRWRVLHELREHGVDLIANARASEITDDVVRFEVSADDGTSEPGEAAADSVIVATGLVANPGPIESLRSTGVRVEVIGDAGGVGYIEGAIHDGFHTAANL
jgi:2,4-dienoyl-CoA reductase (NADPH2)